jgi:RimJ/RimL family protein N-acetyltransferase
LYPPAAWHCLKKATRGIVPPGDRYSLLFSFKKTNMFEIHTPRLRLIPLREPQLHLLTTQRSHLELELGLQPHPFSLNAAPSFIEEFLQAIPAHVIPQMKEHPDDWLWHTHWLMVAKTENVIVGGIGGSGLPDEEGKVMIGYFVDAQVENRGIGTEAVTAFTTWLFQHPQTEIIVADTLVDGIGSQQVLQKNGFHLVGPTEEGLRWHKPRKAL